MDGKGVILKGVITDIFPSEVYGNFEKRVMWMTQEGARYPETWEIQFHQGDCNQLDNYEAGDAVEVTIHIKGTAREKAGKKSVFNALKAVKIEKAGPKGKTRSNRQQTGRADLYNDEDQWDNFK